MPHFAREDNKRTIKVMVKSAALTTRELEAPPATVQELARTTPFLVFPGGTAAVWLQSSVPALPFPEAP
jgi:hypothetical protein